MKKSPLFFKITTLIGCILLLLIPLMLVSHLIADRMDYRDEVKDALRRSTSGPQKVIGPLIAIPITEIKTKIKEQTEDGKTIEKEVQYQQHSLYYWLPESLQVNGEQQVESRKIGIYKGQIWNATLAISAQFDSNRLERLKKNNITIGQPFVVLSVSDSRGIGAVQSAEINGVTRQIEAGTLMPNGEAGVHIPLPANLLQQKQLQISLSLPLLGTDNFSLVPIGRNSEFSLTSNWPHPGFLGDFLPVKRQITHNGFSARWQSNWLANDLPGEFAYRKSIRWSSQPVFNVSLTTPVDQYQLTNRAIKYAILLISLTFMAFFVFETLTGLRLHPLQYLLVGLSLVMFYLVLLALTEHIGFTPAWISASLIGAFINGVYLQAILRGWRNSLLFTSALLVLDGVMWTLLRSLDNALLLGTAVLLLALCLLMFLTRHFDWYSLAKSKESA